VRQNGCFVAVLDSVRYPAAAAQNSKRHADIGWLGETSEAGDLSNAASDGQPILDDELGCDTHATWDQAVRDDDEAGRQRAARGGIAGYWRTEIATGGEGRGWTERGSWM